MAELNVSKKTIKEILDRQGFQYVIPQYQRPYSWDEEKCQTLWSDIVDFFKGIKDDDYSSKSYYLGCIVSIEKPGRKIEIVDGQQRITSLLLLLRAIYAKIATMAPSASVNGQKQQLEKCIWDVDPVSQQVVNFANIRISTEAQLPGQEVPLSVILSTGIVPQEDKTRYSPNYKFFQEKYASFIQDEPQFWERLVYVILNHCVLIPIECGDIDEALKIFNTLNTRGQPLSDADIFKSYLFGYYKTLNTEQEFIEKWNCLNELTINARLKVDDVFRYYAYKLIGEKIAQVNAGQLPLTEDVESLGKEVDLRKFYTDPTYKRYELPGLMDDLLALAKFWESINDDADDYDRTYVDFESKRLLHCLNLYPNINWRRVVSVFFFAHEKDAAVIKEKMPDFLKRLLSYLCVRYVNKPGVDAIRQGIAKACLEMMASRSIAASCSEHVLPANFATKLKPGNFVAEKLTKTLVVLNAYLFDVDGQGLIPQSFNIEHILPRKWRSANYNEWSHETAEREGWLESLGNKIPFEMKLNIQAGNGYFGQKKNLYSKSNIAEVQDLAERPQDDWLKTDVMARLDEMTNRLVNFFMRNLT